MTEALLADTAAERELIGHLIASPQGLDDAIGAMPDDGFLDPLAATLWDALVKMRADGQFIEPQTVAVWLRDHHQADGSASRSWAKIVADLYTDRGVTDPIRWVERVIDVACRRRIQIAARRIDLLAATPGERDALEVLSDAEELIRKAAISTTLTADRDWYDLAIDRAGSPEKAPSVPTGLPGVSRLIRGWRPGQLIIIGARPAVGKSIALLQAAVEAARLGPTLFVSYEMPVLEVVQRQLSSTYRIDLGRIIDGECTDAELGKIAADDKGARDLPLVIRQPRSRSLSALIALCRSTHARTPLRLIAVDYVQLVEARIGGNSSRQQEIGAVSRGMKSLAMELGVPVLTAAQVNRNGADREPTLSDLREAGDLESDADVVILLHVPSTETPEIEAIVAKNRNGPAGRETLVRHGHHARLEGLAS